MLDKENFLQECKSKKERLIKKLEKIEKALENEEILEKDSFKNSTTGGTISITNMNKRWKGIYRVLSKYNE